MSDYSAISERGLMDLCSRHYVCTGMIPTAIAVPLGSLEMLKAEMRAANKFVSPNGTIVLQGPAGHPVSLEEISIPGPVVISDRQPHLSDIP